VDPLSLCAARTCLPLAYIGPGAGFAFLGSLLALFVALVLAGASLLTLPVRLVLGALRRRKTGIRAVADRVIVIGLDGLDPRRTRQLMESGDLPNLTALASRGVFTELRTTCPPLSPVAWSSFATGVNPGKHNIFDFLNRNLRTRAIELSSCRIAMPNARGAGRLRKPEVILLRKSKPFWQVLGEHGIFSTVLRVPITFPPEKFRGLCLSGMCAPDLRGSQGSFTLFEDGPPQQKALTGGERIAVEIRDGRIRTHLPGPPGEDGPLCAPLSLRVSPESRTATLQISGQTVQLAEGVYSDWIRVTFRRRVRSISGICRFLLCSVGPRFRLYAGPLNIDPERPAMPVSHPAYYSIYLAKLHGPFATLGLAEDTRALDEGVIGARAFLQQVYDIHEEREKLFFEALRRTRRGLCCAVFELTDRIQHEFYGGGPGLNGEDAVREAYRRADALVGRTLKEAGQRAVLFVVSDHGFTRFDRGVNLNAWLEEEGYLVRLPDAAGGRDDLGTVDWTRTRAYTFGLGGIYFNRKGREAGGIVEAGEPRARLAAEITAKLLALRDPKTGGAPIRAVYDSLEIYSGPYRENGADLIVGYDDGYRASWEGAIGATGGELFSDNERTWNGDHCVDHTLVPGVYFCSVPVQVPAGGSHIADLAPTLLGLWGIPAPAYMDGRVMEVSVP